MNNRLKELRQQRQWSQSELARQLGVTRQAINGFESGKFDPSLEMAFKLARLFNVSVEDVFVYEAKNSMQLLAERVKIFFGFEFGFERFTPQAINTINFARNEAIRLNYAQVEPENLLSGLLAGPSAIAAQLLQESGALLDVEINERAFDSTETIKLSPQSKFVLEMALQVTRLKGRKDIDTEHLLWGILRLCEAEPSVLDRLFHRWDIDVEQLNHRLATLLEGHSQH